MPSKYTRDPGANLETPSDLKNGYAGSFSVYGYGYWPQPAGGPPSNPEGIRAPIDKDVIATEAVRAAAAQGPEVIVTIVPVFLRNPVADASPALKLEGVSITVQP